MQRQELNGFNFPTPIVIKDQVERELLDDQALLDYIKSGIFYKIDTYCHKNDMTPLQEKISRNNTGMPKYGYGATGRKVAEEYREYIQGIDSVDQLLQTIVLDLKDALRKNEKKTFSNAFGLLAGVVKTSISGRATGEGHRLGSSHELASSIAAVMCDIFNVSLEMRIATEERLVQSQAVDPELKSYIQCLEPAVAEWKSKRRVPGPLQAIPGSESALILDYMGGPG